MTYYLDIFSPETYEAFSHSSQDVSGFRLRHEKVAKRVQLEDKFICYMTKLSRWVGVLEVTSPYFIDRTPIFYPEEDPFILRFKVKPIVWLSKEKSLPIKYERVWNALSFTKGSSYTSQRWSARLQNTLTPLAAQDGQFLENLLLSQRSGGETFLVDVAKYNKLLQRRTM
jgi:hypothetical protein